MEYTDDWSKAKLGDESKNLKNYPMNPLDQIIITCTEAIEYEVEHYQVHDFHAIIEEAVYQAYGQGISDMTTGIQDLSLKLIQRTTE
jgi:hypothetical protein